MPTAASRAAGRKNSATAAPPPALFFETMHAFHRTAALMAALDLDLFTRIAQGAATTAELAEECLVTRRGLRILLDHLVIMGFLRKVARKGGDSAYLLTPECALYLDRRSPSSMAGAMKFLADPRMTEIARDITEAVRSGGTLMPDGGTTQREFAGWVEFARGMAPMMQGPAEFIAELVTGAGARPRPPFTSKAPTRSRVAPQGKLRVLDVAAGHGLFGIAIARRHPQAEIVALDWPAVLQVAKENARQAGVTERYRTLPGSAFEVDFGSGYDLVLLTNFLHHFDRATNVQLLRRAQAALKPGGRALALEFVPDEDRVSPPMAAGFALIMLLDTPAGDAYTFRELDGMFREAGFAPARLHAVPNSPQTVVVAEKQAPASSRPSPAKARAKG
jgi:SAM-dependent methyltransferase